MRVYQERWATRVFNAKSKRDVLRVCKQIAGDDSGHTDILTTALAHAYIKVATPKKPKTSKGPK